MKLILIPILILLSPGLSFAAAPLLNFSDIISGPKTGNTDGSGGLSSSQHGAIVTVWGNRLGSSQGDSKIYVGGVEAAHVYYWKDADGELPGGPADLNTYHQMQEVAFSVPAGAADGAADITVEVNSVESEGLGFTVRTGNISFVRSGGTDDAGCGDWTDSCATLQYMTEGDNGKVVNGDIVYTDGVGVTTGLGIGSDALINGTEARPISIIAYPNTLATMSGTYLSSAATILSVGQGGNDRSDYWNFSKLFINTDSTGLLAMYRMRAVGLAITGPTVVSSGLAGAIGGNGYQAGGVKILGANIYSYGDGVDDGALTQHLFYLSNRRTWIGEDATANLGYEVGWGNFVDNDIYQGIHVYDVANEGGWSTPILIHHNVVTNQWGNSINVDIPSTLTTTTDIYIYNNLVVTDTDYSLAGAPLRINASQHNIYLYNNTIYGYNNQSQMDSGDIRFRNNILFDLEGKPYVNYEPTTYSDNLFYSTAGTPPSLPPWYSAGNGDLNVDPELTNYIPASDSPVVDAGYDTSAVTEYDMRGLFMGTTPEIGAYQYSESAPQQGQVWNWQFTTD